MVGAIASLHFMSANRPKVWGKRPKRETQIGAIASLHFVSANRPYRIYPSIIVYFATANLKSTD
jgi:hypothetical protein